VSTKEASVTSPISPTTLISLSGMLNTILWFYNGNVSVTSDGQGPTNANQNIFVILRFDSSIVTTSSTNQMNIFPLRVLDIGRIPGITSPVFTPAPTGTTVSACSTVPGNISRLFVTTYSTSFNTVVMNNVQNVYIKTWTLNTTTNNVEVVFTALSQQNVVLVFTSGDSASNANAYLYLATRPVAAPVNATGSTQPNSSTGQQVPSSGIPLDIIGRGVNGEAGNGLLGSELWFIGIQTLIEYRRGVPTTVIANEGGVYLFVGVPGQFSATVSVPTTLPTDLANFTPFAQVADFRHIPGARFGTVYSVPSCSVATATALLPSSNTTLGSTSSCLC